MSPPHLFKELGSEPWWQGTPHVSPPPPSPVENVTKAIADALPQIIQMLLQLFCTLPFSPGWNQEAKALWPGRGSASCCYICSVSWCMVRVKTAIYRKVSWWKA